MLALLLGLTLQAHAATDYFQNAVSVDMPASGPVASAITTVTVLGHTCTGFFVDNRAHRPFIATARHCAQFHFMRACELGIVQIRTHVGNVAGTCSHVIASDPTHDAVIFEASLAQNSAHTFLRLSREIAPVGTPLEMYGHPNDRSRQGRPTLTKNCWANNGTDDSKYLAPTDAGPADPTTAYVRAHEKMIAYNCDVYGGNSGGPIVRAGTTAVIGMPATYFPNAYQILPSTASAYYFALAPFIDTNKALLDRAGILVQ